MASVTEFLERRLRLKVNREKSAVARPWESKFLGYSMTWHKQPRLKVAESSIERLKAKVGVIFHEGRGRSLSQVIKGLNALLRGWMQYFRLAEVKGIFDELDGWIRRKLRCLIWLQWKRPKTRMKDAGTSHMNEAFPKSYFDRSGLVSLLDQQRKFQFST